MDKKSSKYNVILFDWDGTLVDSMPLVLAGHNVVRQKLSLPEWTIEDVLAYATKSARETFPVLYGDKAEQADIWFYDYVNAHRFDEIKIYDDVVDLLRSLHDAGYRLGVVSNKKHPYLKIEIEHFNLMPYLQSFVGAGEAEADKPSALPVHMALSRMGYEGHIKNVLYVGDTVTDQQTARAAGMDWAYIHHGERKQSVIEDNPPVWAGEKPGALRSWLL